MTSEAIVSARADIESTEDMFLRAILPDFKVRDELERLRTEVAK